MNPEKSIFKKVIIQGRLEFGKPHTYEKAIEMFHHLIEVRYKTAILVTEEHFKEELLALDFGRSVLQASPKYFKNSVDLIEYLVQFAISGSIGAWMIDDGKVLSAHTVEPASEKSVVQAFLRGRDLSEESGKEVDAIQSLDKALKEYDRHSQAYERRAYINERLGNLDDAIYDFEKSIRLDSRNAKAHLGLGKIKMKQKKYKDAAGHFEDATKSAVALQPIYWVARRLKAMAHLEMNDWAKAAFDLKLFTGRDFSDDELNQSHLQWAWSQYGDVLMQLGHYDESIVAYDHALKSDGQANKKDRAQKLRHRGIAKQKSGGSGFLADWKEAATLGDSQAMKLLENHAN